MWKVSATQIAAFDVAGSPGEACERRFVFDYVEGMRPPQEERSKGAIFGDECHQLWDRYFKTGELPPKNTKHGKIIHSSLHLYPKPDYPGLLSEWKFKETRGSILYGGKLDLIYPEGEIIAWDDHKTSSNPEKYAVTTNRFLRNPQVILYSWAALQKGFRDFVRPRLVYHATKGAVNPFAVTQRIHASEVTHLMDHIIQPVALRIVKTIQEQPKAKDTPPNLRACGAFGRCPHFEYCPLTYQQKLKALLHMSLKKFLDRKKTDLPGVRVNAPEAPSTVEEQHEKSKILGSRLTGSRKKDKEIARQVAAGEEETETNADFDPQKTDAALILRLCSEGWDTFTSRRAEATFEVPFAHGKTLNALQNEGKIVYQKGDGGLVSVALTEEGSDEESMHAGGSNTPEPSESSSDSDYREPYIRFLCATQEPESAQALLAALVEFDSEMA